jgi:hypothetical protein
LSLYLDLFLRSQIAVLILVSLDLPVSDDLGN